MLQQHLLLQVAAMSVSEVIRALEALEFDDWEARLIHLRQVDPSEPATLALAASFSGQAI